MPFDQQVTFLYTPDLAASAHFYGEVLGLPLVLDQGLCRIYRVSGDAFLGVCQRDGAEVNPATVIVPRPAFTCVPGGPALGCSQIVALAGVTK